MRISVGSKIRTTLEVVLFIAFVVLCGLIFWDCYDTWQTRQTAQNLIVVRKTEKRNDADDWSAGMLDINPDYVGWLNVIGTQANGPVVQGENNAEYLRTDFYGNHASGGTFFIDENVRLEEDGNFIVYGHLMNDNTMFGTLKQYKDKDFFSKNGLVRWECESGVYYYKIFAGMVISGDDSKLQSWVNNLDAATQNQMLEEIQEKSFVWQEDKLRTGPYMFLVTCDYQMKNGRLVLVAARM